MAKITGSIEHSKRLWWIRKKTAKNIARQLYAVGQQIELDAELSITQGSISGKGHIPSLPGQPPNADTRHLDGNIETRLEDLYRPKVTVESLAEYSSALEFGTENMEARPFMRPALEKNRENIRQAAKIGVNYSLKDKG